MIIIKILVHIYLLIRLNYCLMLLFRYGVAQSKVCYCLILRLNKIAVACGKLETFKGVLPKIKYVCNIVIH